VLQGTTGPVVHTRKDEAWLTVGGGATVPFQVGSNNESVPVPVTETTTWDLRRR
jgi:hypothetical protein